MKDAHGKMISEELTTLLGKAVTIAESAAALFLEAYQDRTSAYRQRTDELARQRRGERF